MPRKVAKKRFIGRCAHRVADFERAIAQSPTKAVFICRCGHAIRVVEEGKAVVKRETDLYEGQSA